MSDDLDALGGSLFNGFIPQMWKRLMPNTQKPLGSWMSHFLDRYTQYDLWIAHGEPKVIWLSGLHIPESYLTALVQTTCRALNWPLDKATSSTKVTEYTESAMPPAKLECVGRVRNVEAPSVFATPSTWLRRLLDGVESDERLCRTPSTRNSPIAVHTGTVPTSRACTSKAPAGTRKGCVLKDKNRKSWSYLCPSWR